VLNLRRGLLLAAAAGLLFSAAGCSSTPRGATPLAQKSPSEVIGIATAAATAAGSMTFVDVTRAGVTRNGKVVSTLSGASSAPAAQEAIVGADPLQVVLNEQTIYVRATAATLQSALGLTAADATAYAGMWISLQDGDAPFQSLSAALTIASELDNFTPTSPGLRLGPVTTLHGRQVLPVQGAAPTAATGGATGSATLFVSVAAPHVPVAGALVVGGEQSYSEAAVFTKWGHNVATTAPSGAVPYTTFTG